MHACRARGGQQRIGTVGPKPDGRSEGAVEFPREPGIGQSGRLLDDHVGSGFEDSVEDGVRVEQVQRHRVSAGSPQTLGLLRSPEGTDHLVTLSDELRNELAAYGAARPGNEYAHGVLLQSSLSQSPRGPCH